MLELQDICLESGGRPILRNVSASYPLQHLGAILGPSGCGKTSLLKLIAGIAPGQEDGEILWRGESLKSKEFDPSEIAYVPQFGIAQDDLTSRETVRFSSALRLRNPDQREQIVRVDRILSDVGMEETADQKVKTLSGGQRRRLALASELVSHPEILLCDEVTSGLDPLSEDEVVELLRSQAHHSGRLVLTVTHSLAHLHLYDSVLVMFRGILAYHGPPHLLCHYFGIDRSENLYVALAGRSAEEWQSSWAELGAAYKPTASLGSGWNNLNSRPANSLPNAFSQFFTLLNRRFIIFLRSPPQILLQAGLILGFPFIASLFAINGLPALISLTPGLTSDVSQQLADTKNYLTHSSKVGSLVSGMVMFQVILLTLMGANNSGREIANERMMYEKERLSGLRPSAYVASKIAFLAIFVLMQSAWMGTFIHYVCRFPGDLVQQLFFLLLVNTAITTTCLAISSWLDSPDQASLASIYLVGFQLPLSGTVLALPESIAPFIRPFISAYWSWSGILETLREGQYFEVVRTIAQSPIVDAPICALVLAAQTGIALAATYLGCERRALA